MAALARIGYTRCVSEEFEAGVEKIAIFVGVDGEYSHVARQLAEGQWTSKIGKAHDISHRLRQLEGDEYGRVSFFMSRARP